MGIESIKGLVERFTDHLAEYKSPSYNETQVRHDFIDPFFEALGWDMSNKQGFSQTFRQVIHEDSLNVEGATKSPDYCFQLGGRRVFFVEAKKPAVDLKEDIHPAYQLRRYAWSARLPVSILTDFEEFAVYDCRVKPTQADKASAARVLYLPFNEYPARWDELTGLFSPEAIQKGAIEKYVGSAKLKRGTAQVDDAFLEEIEGWRELLAKSIALRNDGLTQRDLNFAVQRTIDRVIFLRICEDRGIETYATLQEFLNGANIYQRLVEYFRRADERYNSGLFHFRDEKDQSETPDTLTPRIKIDDKPLKDILKKLYYPDCPYEFSVLGADILGSVYERFLGKVIRLTAGHRAVVEEKPEVRKAGGVYYTPDFITKAIVRKTIGPILEGKTARQVSKLRFCDMACGSGSFLIELFQFLLDWHLDFYIKDGPQKYNKMLHKYGDDWILNTEEKKRILLNNIFGVDIDTQAVEVTKLSLLLKVLEGESQETISKQLALFHQRALPDLASNIKCGNSLIGPEAYKHRQLSLLPEEDRYRINIFDWQRAFPKIMKDGGFDGIIGNPPYIRIQTMKEWAPVEVELYKALYRSASAGNYDIYVVFVEKALSLLNKTGRLGFILPHKFFNSKYGEALRGLISEGKHLSQVVHFGDQQVFEGATTYTCLLFLDKAGSSECQVEKVTDLDAWRAEGKATEGRIPAKKITAAEWNFSVGKDAALFERLTKMPLKLGDVAHIFQGLVTGADKVFIVTADAGIENGLTKPFLLTGDLAAYTTAPAAARIIFPYEIHTGKAELISAEILKKRFPKGWTYLSERREVLMNRELGKWHHEHWYAFGRAQNLTQMDASKLIIQVTAQRPTVLLDECGLYMTGGGSGPPLCQYD